MRAVCRLMESLPVLLSSLVTLSSVSLSLRPWKYKLEETPDKHIYNDDKNADVYDDCRPRGLCRNGGQCLQDEKDYSYLQIFGRCKCHDPIFSGRKCELTKRCPGYSWTWSFLQKEDVKAPFEGSNLTDEEKLTLIEHEFSRYIVIHFPDSFTNMSSPEPPAVYDWGFEVIECRKDIVTMFLNALGSANVSSLSPGLQTRYIILQYILTNYLNNMEKWKYFAGSNRLSNYEGFFLRDINIVIGKMRKHWRKWSNHTIIRTHNLLQSLASNITHTWQHALRRGISSYVSSLHLLPRIFDQLMEREIGLLNATRRKYGERAPDDYYDNLLVHPLERYPVKNVITKARFALAYQMSAIKSFLKHVYWPSLRKKPSILSARGGKGFYMASLEWYLGEPSPDPDRILDHAQWKVHKITGRVQEMMSKDGFQGKLKNYFNKLNKEVQPIANRDIPKEINRLLDKVIKPRVAKVMDVVLPPNPRVVVQTRWWKGTYYDRDTLYISPVITPRYRLLPLAMRLAIPGEHFRQNYLRSRTDVPLYLKAPVILRGAVPTIPQGWGAYAETLSKDMGLHEETNYRLAFYAEEMLRAASAAIDVGIHWKSWSRATAADYLYQLTAFPDNLLARIVDSVISLPGEATAALMGQAKLEELRRLYQYKHGDKFDLKEFHRKVLKVIPGPQVLLTTVLHDVP